jgi:hypothetical protein
MSHILENSRCTSHRTTIPTASPPHQHEIQLHSCALFDSAWLETGPESVSGSAREELIALDGDCLSGDPSGLFIFASACSDFPSEKSVGTGWLPGRWRWIPWRLCADRWFFTSLFLTKLMIAPAVRLLALKGTRLERCHECQRRERESLFQLREYSHSDSRPGSFEIASVRPHDRLRTVTTSYVERFGPLEPWA